MQAFNDGDVIREYAALLNILPFLIKMQDKDS